MNKLASLKDKYVYIASAIFCVVILLGKYCYIKYQEFSIEQLKQKAAMIQKEEAVNSASHGIEIGKTTEKAVNPASHGIEIGKTTEKAINPAPYGIEIGKTTEEAIRTKFNVFKNFTVMNDKYQMLCLNPKDFSSDDFLVKKVHVVLNQNGIVERFQIVYIGKNFSQLHLSLSKKYKLVSSEIPFVGDHMATYESNNTLILLSQIHLEFHTCLLYCTKQFQKDCMEFVDNQEKEEQARIDVRL